MAVAISRQLFLVGVTNCDGPFDLSCHGAYRPALGGLHNLLLRPQVDERHNTRRVKAKSAGPKPAPFGLRHPAKLVFWLDCYARY
jgi:hypothetical protein